MKTLQTTLDRWEGDHGILEGIGAIPAALLPSAAREGDVLSIEQCENHLILTIDPHARAAREKAAQADRDGLVRGTIPVTGDIEL